MIGFYNRDVVCLLRGTDWVFNCNYFTLISVRNALQDTAFSRNLRAAVAVFCNECNRFVKNEPFCATSWCPYAVLCAVVASCRLPSRSYHVSLFHFITHTSLPAGVHIDPQRDPVSGRSLRSQANLVVAGITRCNCPFWFIATDPIRVLSRTHYNRKHLFVHIRISLNFDTACPNPTTVAVALSRKPVSGGCLKALKVLHI